MWTSDEARSSNLGVVQKMHCIDGSTRANEARRTAMAVSTSSSVISAAMISQVTSSAAAAAGKSRER